MTIAQEGRPVRIAILGAGGRGREAYGSWALRHPERASIVAIADNAPSRLHSFADDAGVPTGARFDSWQTLLGSAEALDLDAVVIALPDREHVPPALRAAALGLPILLEKPAAVTREDLEELSAGAREHSARIAVGHVLRYTPFWRTVSQIASSEIFGKLITIRLDENIGFWHFAHSYVRGNWRRADEASPMVLAKTCHDLDLIRWLADDRPTSVTSVGSLSYFTAANAPPGAPDRCLDGCPHAATCPFYAPRYYNDALRDVEGWPVALLSVDTSPEGRTAALRTGPYGRCVFHSDNDVADHQQTVMEFPSGLTATLSASAFTGENTRTVRITATKGELSGHMDSGQISVDLFTPGAELPDLPEAIVDSRREKGPLHHPAWDIRATAEGTVEGDHRGHAGGDDGLMDAFVHAVAHGVTSGAPFAFEDALDSHRMAFAAEESRLSRQTIAWR